MGASPNTTTSHVIIFVGWCLSGASSLLPIERTDISNTAKNNGKNQWDQHCTIIILGKTNKPNSNQQSVIPTVGRRWVMGEEEKEKSFGGCKSISTQWLAEVSCIFFWRPVPKQCLPHRGDWLAEWQKPWRWVYFLQLQCTAYLLFLFITLYRGPVIMPAYWVKFCWLRVGGCLGSMARERQIICIFCNTMHKQNTHF